MHLTKCCATTCTRSRPPMAIARHHGQELGLKEIEARSHQLMVEPTASGWHEKCEALNNACFPVVHPHKNAPSTTVYRIVTTIYRRLISWTTSITICEYLINIATTLWTELNITLVVAVNTISIALLTPFGTPNRTVDADDNYDGRNMNKISAPRGHPEVISL